MDRVLYWTKKDKNIYSRSWELETVTNSLSSSVSKAHKAHCPKKDVSYRAFIVCHFRRQSGILTELNPGCVKIIIYWGQLQNLMFQMSNFAPHKMLKCF